MKKNFLLLAIIIFSMPVFAAEVPKTMGYVNDYAGILSNAGQLESMLSVLEKNTTVEFAIVTLSSIPADETKETYAYKILTEWGIGKKGENNGLLLMIIANGTPGNRLRMEVGYGLEGYITDATAGRILDNALPYYESRDYSQAAYIVVTEVEQVLEEKNYTSGYTRSFNIPSLGLFFFMNVLPVIFFPIIMIAAMLSVRPRCPYCSSSKLTADGDYYICQKCKRKFKKSKARTHHGALIAGGLAGGGHGGFGGGGFGGGMGGGGGAGR